MLLVVMHNFRSEGQLRKGYVLIFSFHFSSGRAPPMHVDVGSGGARLAQGFHFHKAPRNVNKILGHERRQITHPAGNPSRMHI